MSETIMLFTILILSSAKLTLIHEKYNLKTKTSIERNEYSFANSQDGFVALSKKITVLQKNEPKRECLFDLSEEEGGYLGKLTRIEKKPVPKSLYELSDLCRN
ncbi:hypothetical protein [Leptospira idonii]|uniref:Uncharacterized protein n=1 Tax=Leptospira idonii TaxID=1193500 RepID=A0A4R9M381_9LEPT|nr:hypothetical protein [Leptospira idonii]TGN20197.1 hypothetical protein EHS15_05775 [Leptospira idonii]